MIVYAKVPIDAQYDAMEKDFNCALLHWKAHFNTSNYEGSWTGLPLRSVEGIDSIVPGLTSDDVFKDHANMIMFPSIKSLLNTFNCTVRSVRLLNLAAGAVIKPHCDRALSFEQGEVRLHIPLATNPEVEFYVNDKQIVMQVGECWYINANLKHNVINGGKTDRIHLVIDCKVNNWMRQLMESAVLAEHVPDYSLEEVSNMITALRVLNTVRSNQMADEFQKQYNVFPKSRGA